MSLPSCRRHWMKSRLRTKLRAGGSQVHYQQFDSSTSGTDDELFEAMFLLPTYPQDLEQPEVHTEPTLKPEARNLVSDIFFQGCLTQLFSDHETALCSSINESFAH